MGSRELLAGILWRARAGIRTDGVSLRAGHGMADAAYRPPALPYVSVVGPLTVELEPERTLPRAIVVPVQAPGYLAGRPRAVTDVVPGPGDLVLLADGDLRVVATLDPGPLSGRAWADGDVGPAVAALLQRAVRAGVATTVGLPVTDPDRLADLAAMTVRWDVGRRRIVVSSGRRGVLTGADLQARQPSSVEPGEPDGPLARGLGLQPAPVAADPPVPVGELPVVAPGRIIRHRRPTPTAVAVDVRVDLWAGSQSELAAVLDAWTRITATRGQLLVQPAVLAADVAATDSSIRLLSPAEPRARTTLVLLDPVDGSFVDRVTGRVTRLRDGARVVAGELSLTGGQGAELTFFDRSPVPSPWEPDTPTTRGYAATIGVSARSVGGGDRARVLTLRSDPDTALFLEIEGVAAGVEVRIGADRVGGGGFAAAAGVLPAASLARGVDLHACLDAGRGALTLWADGELLADGGLSDPGIPVGSPGMRLELGAPPGGPDNPVELRVRHVHLHAAPVGAPDPRLRLAAAPASAWSPGDPVVLARSDDAVGTSGDGVPASVLGVDGDRLLLDRPVGAAFPRTGSIAFRRSEFFSQRSLRRSDDLMNQLFRISAEYRVSTLLDEPDPRWSAPLVETVDVQTRDFARLAAELAGTTEPLSSGRPASGAPGASARFALNPTRSTRTDESTVTEETHA